ncbi:hypothetical protein C8F01DRAFT_1271771, partial [Mycena amicta]
HRLPDETTRTRLSTPGCGGYTYTPTRVASLWTRMDCAVDRARLIEVESEIQKLKEHLAALRSERTEIRQRLDEYAYPVLTVPNEIITEIIMHYLPLYPDHPPLLGPGSPTYLLGICRLWRNVALHSPALWRSIRLRRSSNQHLELTKAWLQRSGGCLVSLCFNFETSEAAGPEVANSLLQVALAHHSRWEYIEFLYLAPHLLPLTCLLAPNLVQLQLHMALIAPNSISAQQTISLHNAELLRVVCLWGIPYGIISLPWNQLTSLVLRETTFTDATRILQTVQNLHSCKLYLKRTGEGIHVHLPRLEFMSLIAAHSPARLDDTDLGAFTLPALRKLEIDEGVNAAVEQLKSLISRSKCRLERLRIVRMWGTGPSLEPYRTTFPLIDVDHIDFWQCSVSWQLEKEEYWNHAPAKGSSRGSLMSGSDSDSEADSD